MIQPIKHSYQNNKGMEDVSFHALNNYFPS